MAWGFLVKICCFYMNKETKEEPKQILGMISERKNGIQESTWSLQHKVKVKYHLVFPIKKDREKQILPNNYF